MADLHCEMPYPDQGIGGLQLGPDGDLLLCDGDTESRQRVTRRIVTKSRVVAADGTPLPGDYLFDNTYGIGAGRVVGQGVNAAKIEALRQIVRDGLMNESDFVAPNPPPEVAIQVVNGILFLAARYTSASTQRPLATPRIAIT